MAVTLNNRAFTHAKELISKGEFVKDERDDWSEHQPSAEQENKYLEKHGWQDYGRWYLGVDDEMGEDTKKVHRCGVISAESRAAQQDYEDIDNAFAHLHGLIDGAHD